jgi:hypothetical protein
MTSNVDTILPSKKIPFWQNSIGKKVLDARKTRRIKAKRVFLQPLSL